VRVVARPESGPEESLELVIDVGRRMPGRGAWLHPDPQCLELALRRKAFPRALRVAGRLGDAALRGGFARHVGKIDSTGSVPGAARPSDADMGSGLEADGYPMSTQR
jgi:uncharacterized protein